MQNRFHQSSPFRLLAYLEWILLGIALVTIIAPPLFPGLPPPRRSFQGYFHLDNWLFRLGALFGLISFGGLGLRLPLQSRFWQVIHTLLSLGLSWLVVMLRGQGQTVFVPLLLIVVIRACCLFPWLGRIVVAVIAYLSYLSMLLLAFFRIAPLGIPLDRSTAILLRRVPPDLVPSIFFGFILNAAVLYGLVFGFVLLLVGTLISESHNRQQLASANQRLRNYALLIENQAALEERSRIAREIHDSVGHSLAAQSIQLENAAMLIFPNPHKAMEHLQTSQQLGRQALQNVRQSVAQLRQDPLQGQSIGQAISSLVDEFQRHYPSIQVNLTTDIQSLWPSEIVIAIYRITQEALTNVARHSMANQVHLILQEQESQAILKINDNGRGFDPQQNTTGFGTRSMRERAQALNGQLELTSQPQMGCQIQVVVPLQAA